MNFIPNPFKWFYGEIEFAKMSIPTYAKFQENDFDGLFLKNLGNILFLIVILLFIHTIGRLLHNINSSFMRKVARVCQNQLGLGFTVKILISMTIIILVSCTL